MTPDREGEDFWFAVQRAFPVNRSILNLDNGNLDGIDARELTTHLWREHQRKRAGCAPTTSPRRRAVRSTWSPWGTTVSRTAATKTGG